MLNQMSRGCNTLKCGFGWLWPMGSSLSRVFLAVYGYADGQGYIKLHL
jgi:hypothetical protein